MLCKESAMTVEMKNRKPSKALTLNSGPQQEAHLSFVGGPRPRLSRRVAGPSNSGRCDHAERTGRMGATHTPPEELSSKTTPTLRRRPLEEGTSVPAAPMAQSHEARLGNPEAPHGSARWPGTTGGEPARQSHGMPRPGRFLSHPGTLWPIRTVRGLISDIGA